MKEQDMAPALSKGKNKIAKSNVRKKWETSKEKGITMYQELDPYPSSSAPCHAIVKCHLLRFKNQLLWQKNSLLPNFCNVLKRTLGDPDKEDTVLYLYAYVCVCVCVCVHDAWPPHLYP